MVRRTAALVIVCGAMTLLPALAAGAPANVGPPPTLPDVGPPPALPDFGPQNVPPTTTTPSTPPGPAPQRPAPPAGPPVMRPTVRAPAPAPTTPPSVTTPAPTEPPPVTLPPAPEPAPEGGVPLPPAPGPVSPASPEPGGDPSLAAPMMEGADPVAPEEGPKAPVKTREEEEEEAARALRKEPKKWRHAGLIVEPRLGVLGCTRQFCATSQGHRERPGALLGGFIGSNILGLVDIGIEASWATLRPGELKGKNAVTLFGLDPPRVEQALSERLGMKVDVDFDQLIVNTAKARAISAGPALRIHFIRKGRGVAYVGAGLQYQLWRNRYESTGGPTRIDFHGFSAPFRFGGGAFVHPNIAVLGEFAYHYAFYVITGVSHPELSGFAPLTIIEGAALDAGANLRKGLPHFWSFSVSVRFRLGL